MKKTISILLAFTFIFSLCSCGTDDTRKAEESLYEMFTTDSDKVTGESVAAEKETQIELESTTEEQKVSQEMVIYGQEGSAYENGRAPLDAVSYTITDPNNERGLSTAKIGHSHGPASGGQPHHTVVSFQDTFDKYGALTLDRTSSEKVLYLTFDCGWEYNNLTSNILDTLKEKNVPAAFFCTLDHIKKQPELIKRMIDEKHIVGNHSTTHPSFAQISRTQVVQEIEETENYLREHFGYCAKYFRFPSGEYNESALELISSLGYMSVFWSVAYDDWNVEQIKGKDYAVNTVMDRLHDGAVILLHAVSQDNAQALGEIIDKAREQGFEFKALTDYKAS